MNDQNAANLNQPDIVSNPIGWNVFLRDHAGWMLSVFLIGLGAKLWLIQRSGTPLSFWDQWDGEARFLYAPYFEGHLTLRMLFRAHNEHRIFFTRIYDLALLLLNGQWDNQLQMVGNAIIHSAILAGFGGLIARVIGKAIWPFIWIPLVLALVLPFAWENTLSGFQSQFYFLLLFSLLTIWLVGLSRPLSAKWWLGTVTAIAALFTTASGFLASDAVVALVMLDLLKRRRSQRQCLPTLAFCGVITIAGFLLKKDVPAHHLLMAHSLREFVISLGNNLAWPWIVLPPYALCNFFPLILLGWFYLRDKEESPGERLVLGIGFWVGAQAAAAAYGRGAGGSLPYWRYMDSSSFTMIANCAAIGLLLIRYRQQLWPARLWRAGFVLWACGCLSGLTLLTNRAWQIDIPEREFYQRMLLKTTRAFVATDDIHVLEHKPPLHLLLRDDIESEAMLIRNPDIRRVLPACVRPPLKVEFPEGSGLASPSGDCAPVLKDLPPEPVRGFCPVPGLKSPRTLESLPVQKSALPYLEFPVTGDLGAPGLSLDLVESLDGRAKPVKSLASGEGKWTSAYARAPAGEFKIVARDESGTGWFVFRQPRELGRLSYWAIQILAAWKYFLAAGIGCFLISLIWSVAQRPDSRAKTGGAGQGGA